MHKAATTRLGRHFTLADFVGCHTVFAHGAANGFAGTRDHLREARCLVGRLLDPIVDAHGPLSISYGYISPGLSRRVVKYQDPDKPSYHRWDAGAAADIIVHDHVGRRGARSAPIYLAHKIDRDFEYSRMITYSESPCICIATRLEEKNGRSREAFYENRFLGVPKAKPKFITKSRDFHRRVAEGEKLKLEHDWRGAGYPTYHGGGIKQAQHYRVSRYTVLSDWLVDLEKIEEGEKNFPLLNEKMIAKFKFVASIYDDLRDMRQAGRFSIVQGWSAGTEYAWRDGEFRFVLALPTYCNVQEFIENQLANIPEIEHTEVIDEQLIKVIGRFE